MQSGTNKYDTPAAFAERIGVPAERVIRWIREGRIPHVKLGRTILVPRDALDRLLNHQQADR